LCSQILLPRHFPLAGPDPLTEEKLGPPLRVGAQPEQILSRLLGQGSSCCGLGQRVPQIALHQLTDRINSNAMSIAELRQLPRREKLQIVESLWSDLAAEESLVQSPSWHGEELRKTEEDLKLGNIRPVNWGASKKKLRKQFE